jgi:MFS family permease
MNSLPWIGKILGCFLSDLFIDKGGYKNTMYAAAGIQIVGVIRKSELGQEFSYYHWTDSCEVEMSARHWLQFTIGRDVTYFAVGLVENAVPSYNAEISPAATRGLLSGSLMFFTALGNLWGAGMSRAFATEQDRQGWMIPTAMQFIPAILIVGLVPFTPESPRWLILKGKKELAQQNLDKIRHKHEVEDGTTVTELAAMSELVEHSLASEEGSWKDLFSAKYIRQSWIAATLFAIQQNNGNQFVQSYAATFYVEQGLGAMSFTYNMIGQAIGILGCLTGTILFDISGRRPLFIYGCCVCVFLLYLGSGIGDRSNPNQTETRTMVSTFMILPFFTRISATNCSFLTGAEIGGVRMRKKIMVSPPTNRLKALLRKSE